MKKIAAILALAIFAVLVLACSTPAPISQRVDAGPPTTGSILLLAPLPRPALAPAYSVKPTSRSADPAPVVQGLSPDDRTSRLVLPAMPRTPTPAPVVEDVRAASSWRLAAGLVTIAAIALGFLAFMLAKRRRAES